jgi:hypothetical protein
MAPALLLLAGAGLLIKSFGRFVTVGLASADHILTFDLGLARNTRPRVPVGVLPGTLG